MKLGHKSPPKKSNTDTDSRVRSDGDMAAVGGGLNVLPAFQAMQALPKQASQQVTQLSRLLPY